MIKVLMKEMVRVRCTEEWKRELEIFSASKNLDISDAVRIAVDDLKERHSEKPKRLKPVSLQNAA